MTISSRKEEFHRGLGTIVLYLLTGILAGILLLAASALIPASALEKHLIDSAELLSSEGDWRPVIPGYNGTQLDNYTDALLLQIAYQGCRRENGNVFVRAMENPYELLPDAYAVASLKGVLSGKEGNKASYARYFLGGTAILRILLCLFSYGQIRVLFGICESILLIVVLYGMAKKGYGILIPAFLGMILLWYPVVLPFSLQLSAIYFVMMGAVIAYLYLPGKSSYLLYFLVIGMITGYVDFLTFPVLTLGIPMGFVLWDTCKKHDEKELVALSFTEYFIKGISYSVVWLIGYGGIWAGKWIAGSLFLRRNLILEALRTVRTRTSRHSGDTAFSYFDVLIANWNVINRVPIWIGMGVVILLIVGIVVWKLTRKRFCGKGNEGNCEQADNFPAAEQRRDICSLCFALLILALFPFGWYMVAGNHSYVHSWYTFREYSLTAWALLLMFTAICSALTWKQRKSN